MARRLIIREGSRDNALAIYLPLFQKRGINVSVSQLKQFLLRKFVSEAGIHALSERSNYYLSGVARYYFHGDLTDNKTLNAFDDNVKDEFKPDVCSKLDIIIRILRDAYIDSVGTQFEQPEDFGNMSLAQLLRKYGRKLKKAEDQNEQAPSNTVGDYTYEILYNYESAQKYNSATEPGAWCITYGKQHFDGYVKRLGIHYVVFRKNGYENVPREKGPGFTPQKPQDEYGNSLICVLQSNNSPEAVYITSRWNHGVYNEGTRCEADHAYTTEEFLNVIGSDASILQKTYDEWKKYKPSKSRAKKEEQLAMESVVRHTKYLQMLMNNGYKPEDLFTEITPFRPPLGQYKGYSLMHFDFNNSKYIVLAKGKKLLYDVFLTIDNPGLYYNKYNPVSHRFVAFFGDDVKYKLYRTVVLDMATGKPVEIDGHTSFFISDGISHGKEWYGTKNPKFALFAVSRNQLALVDLETMTPMQTDDGKIWFEDIKYQYGGSESKTRIPHLGGLKSIVCTYDSSADENYIFSTTTKKFVNCPKGYGPFESSDCDLVQVWEKGDYTHNEIFVFNVTSGEFININGKSRFTCSNLNIFDNVIVGWDNSDRRYFGYDTKTGEELKINGIGFYEWLMENSHKFMPGATNEIWLTYRANYIRINLPSLAGENYIGREVIILLYNTLEHEFFHIGNEYIIRNKVTRPDNRLYHPFNPVSYVGNRPIKIPKAEDMKAYIAEKESEVREGIKRNFFDVLNSISRRETIY